MSPPLWFLAGAYTALAGVWIGYLASRWVPRLQARFMLWRTLRKWSKWRRRNPGPPPPQHPNCRCVLKPMNREDL